MTASSLRALTRKALAARAKKQQIAGWHDMTKDELVSALVTAFRRQRGRALVPSLQRSPNGASTRDRTKTSIAARPAAERAAKAVPRELGGGHLNGRRLLRPTGLASAPRAVSDSLVAQSRHPCWIEVRWTLSRDTLNRAEAAMGLQWHVAVPVLRIFDVTTDERVMSAHTRVRDVDIHGDVDHWYVPVENSPRTYQMKIGYRAPSGLFFAMAQSNRVQTPRPGSHSLRIRENGAARRAGGAGDPVPQFEKTPTYDLRALPTAKLRNGNGHVNHESQSDVDEQSLPLPVELRLHAELILHGTTDPHAQLTLLGDRIPISRDGTFSQRFALPDGRQVIDAVVTTRNGCHQRTVVLGIERNTKELEPQWFDEINNA